MLALSSMEILFSLFLYSSLSSLMKIKCGSLSLILTHAMRHLQNLNDNLSFLADPVLRDKICSHSKTISSNCSICSSIFEHAHFNEARAM